MTLQQLRYFLATARHGSFAGAADELLLKQPSVAEQIRRLEAELGVPLFARTRRRLTLTAAGLALRPYAEQALTTAQDGADAVRAHRTLRGGIASFGLPRNAELYALTDLAAEMHTRHPLVGMRLIGQNSVEVADAIREGALEAGLVVLPVDDEGLDIEPVIRDEVLYATADAGRAAAPISVEALRDARLVLYDAHYGNGDPTRRQLNDRLQQLGGRLEPHIEVEYLAGALRLAALGVGDTIVARAAVDGGLVPDGLLTTPFADPLYDTLAVAKQRQLPLSPATRELLSIALERLAAFDRRRNRTGPRA
ncbi:LysR family transcriptional regulator [Solirubrobacter sp. CPCC 204708]|uniref:LysR family transcriptional regulator n=1 Tax=Solirubrobacter deserti TaxID=2282478 RepID=A0ABT4RCM3_9ACTN|nr:LysR family transcriptional regulator [Solirubrobacter deserti]MBE2315644.1 LysR family transcriptional regulator [Solirubrobacter deserti]MDA0136284.1 LysR family transcriptional regulator [Solirubrobacter deserti]